MSKVKSLLQSEHKYIQEVLAPVSDRVLKSWNKEYKEIESKLEKRYKSMIQIIKKSEIT